MLAQTTFDNIEIMFNSIESTLIVKNFSTYIKFIILSIPGNSVSHFSKFEKNDEIGTK